MNENIRNKYLLTSFISVAITMLLTPWVHYQNEILSYLWLFIYSSIIINFYLSVIYLISNSKEDLEHKNIFKAVYTYLLLNVVIIAWFAFAVMSFNGIICEKYCSSIELLNAIYYSTVSFTTIGFGEILPVNNFGKILLILEALIGSITTATFISVVFLKFKK